MNRDGAVKAEIREGQITKQLRVQEKELDLARELLNNLEDRLSQVLLNDQASPEDDRKDAEKLVSIANNIQNNTINIDYICDRIRNITDRLEI